MIVGIDFFQGDCFQTTVALPSFYRTEMSNSVVDEILIDEDISITNSIDKPTGWGYYTVLNALFQSDLEGGSLNANGLVVDHILFQKRKAEDLFWSDVAKIEFNENTFYEAIDKYIQNSSEYEYSLIPYVSGVPGNRIVSPKIVTDFNGVFLSDLLNNYSLQYDVIYGTVTHNTQSTSLEPLNAQYPIIVYGSADYVSIECKSTSISDATINSGGKIDIKQEKLKRQQLMSWLKNKKPKIYRAGNGDIYLVSLMGNPSEEHQEGLPGIAKISFNLTEIGNIDSDTLSSYGLLEGLTTTF